LLEVGRAGKLRVWLSWRPFQLLGKISYSLYLFHGPICVVTLQYTLYRLTPRTAAWELFWLVVLLAADCIGAWFIWRLVEKPCMALSQRCKPSAQMAHPTNPVGPVQPACVDRDTVACGALRSAVSHGDRGALSE
jgi:peptidoglycan/LPS O-acetylase OafA/YrhL